MKKMIMAVVPRDQANHLLECLVDAGYSATYTESRGGMLRQSQESLFIMVEEEQVDDVLALFRGDCGEGHEHRTFGDSDPGAEEPGLSGAIAFVWDIDRVETF